MKGRIGLVVLGLVIAASASFALQIRTIGPGKMHPTFQDAAAWLTANSPLSDDIVFEVYSGTYTGQTNIQSFSHNGKSVTFRPASGQNVVINAGTSYAFSISSVNRVRIEGLRLIGATSYAVYLNNADTCVIKGCVIRAANGVGIEGSSDYDSIVGNDIRVTSSYGIYITSSYTNYYIHVANNFLVGWASYGIYAYSHYYTEFYYNTIYTTSGSYALLSYYGYNEKQQNNILVSPSTYTYYRYYGDNFPQVSNNNCFWRLDAGTSVIYSYSYGAQTLAQWRSSTSRDLNSINVDPLIGGTLNPHLKTGSPCIGAGAPVTGITKDIDGDTRKSGTPPNGPDIGADEYTSVGAAMSGTYTIKQDGTGDFRSFDQALGAVVLRGLAGNVTFDVYCGAYYENLDIQSMPTGTYSVTFQAFEATDGPHLVTLHAGGASYAVYMRDVSRIRFKNINVTGFTSYGFYLTYSNTSIGADKNVIQGCRISGPNGIYISDYCDDDSIVGNDISVTSSYGIFFDGSAYQYRTVIINNFIYGWTSYGIYAYYHYDTELYFNTIYSASGSYAFYDYYGYSSSPPTVAKKYKNNIYYSSSYCYYTYYGTQPPTESDNNCFWLSGGGTSVIYDQGTARTLASWQSTRNRDLASINQDPLVTSTGNMHIKPGSPCIGKGTVITGVTTDIDGDTRKSGTPPNGPDIGADEYVAKSPLSGTYTIKQDGTGDFRSFREAVNAVFAQGLGDAVVFNVYSGIYLENLVIENLPTNTYPVTFQAAPGQTVTLDAGNTSNAVYMRDVNRFRFKGITVTGFTSYGFYLGYISTSYGADKNVIQGCRISGPNGIYVDAYCDDDSIVGNDIGVTSSYGINLTSTNYRYRTVIINNFIYGWTSYGIYAYYHYDTELYYNTIYSTSGSYAFYDYYGYSSSPPTFGKKYKNNIYYSSSYCYYTYYGTQPPTESDNNCFWLSGGGTSVIYDNGTARDLASWRSARSRDLASINLNPQIMSSTDLHVSGFSPCIGKGAVITGVTTDIDGDTRKSGTPPNGPDIGADEFAGTNRMSGTYTIKKSGGDYASFGAAITDMRRRGVSGPVTFEVYTGTYNEAISLAGLMTPYSVTFQAHETPDAVDNVTLNAGGASYAVYLVDVRRFRFRKLTVTNYASYGFYLYGQSFDVGADTCLIEGCKIVGPNGIYIGQYCDDDSIIGNDIRPNGSNNTGINITGYSDANYYCKRTVIANNFINSSNSPYYALYFYYHDFTNVYYNTCYGNYSQQLVRDYYGRYGTYKNNIYDQLGTGYIFYWYYGSNLTTDYNCYWRPSGGSFIYYSGSAYTWATRPSWFDPNGINQDPQVGGYMDLHLKGTSPCIGKGTALSWPTKDFDGQDRGSTVDIGADEWTYPGAAMSGVYTIKQDGTGDFRDFNEALGGIVLRGMAGNVIFDVYAGTYTGKVTIEGINNPYRVTFRAHETADGYDEVIVSSGSDYGFNLRDQSDFAFRNLIVRDFTSYGFYLQHVDVYTGCDRVTIAGCKIYGPNGIYLHYGADDDSILGNEIKVTSSYGIYLYGYSSYYSKRNVIANNFIYGFTSRGAYLYYHDETKLYYNTIVNLSSSNYYLVEDQSGFFMQSRNNILYQQTSGNYCYYKNSGNTLSSNYNCFFNNGTSTIAYYNGSSYTWATWRSSLGMDLNGVNANPLFVSNSDLHLQPGSPCIDVATPITGITTDIDGHGRGSRPDIGADELYRDITVDQVNIPTGLIPLFVPVTPQVHVKNIEGPAATVDLVFKVFKGATEVHSQTKTGVTLNPSEEKTVSFDNTWTPSQPGADYTTVCWHSLTPDGASANDTARGTVEVATIDVEILEMVQPTNWVVQGTDVYPELRLRNNGQFAANVTVLFTIDDNPPQGDAVRKDAAQEDAIVYSEVRSLNIPAGQELPLVFDAAWLAEDLGNYYAKAYHWLTNDQNRHNDTIDRYFEVISGIDHDVGATAILAPTGILFPGEEVFPKVRVKNYGEVAEPTVPVRVRITGPADAEVYNEVMTVSLGLNEEKDVTFTKGWTPADLGDYAVVCSTEMAYDNEFENDATHGTCTVVERPPWPEGWTEVRSVPTEPTSKAVKDGAWLAVGPDQTDEGEVIYVAKGNKTTDFYKYYPTDGDSGTWQERAPIPALEDGRTKPPSKGCVGVSDGERYVYMTKGNNTLGFWRYDITTNQWDSMGGVGVPLGKYNKKVKGGTDMVFATYKDTGCVYLLKGYKTEFYRYNPVAGRWDTLPEVPYGANKQKYDKGSFLVYDGLNTIYAHQAKYFDRSDNPHHFMFRYDVAADSWYKTALPGMPVYGLEGGRYKKKKSADGAAGVWTGGYLYALKGGNTQGFFKYFPGADTWTQLDTVPGNGSFGKKKRVKSGGDLVAYGAAFFALKGNKCYELWRYVEPIAAYGLPLAASRFGVQAGLSAQGSGFIVSPNPIASGWATLRYSLPKAGPIAVTVFDIAGRAVLRQAYGVGRSASSIPLDLRSLTNGIYLVRLDAEGYTATQKLVVQR
ncbi:MAG: right-handed parallel beta-helix repeat-containing protein [candidate division WOR-3 bacterium]